jgi:hypothetical protein
MSYPTSRADRYRKAAEELSHLAESAPSDFIRGYYQRTAERCLLVAEGEAAPLPKWATAAVPSEATPPLSHEVIASVPDQAMAPLPDEAMPRQGKTEPRSHVESEVTPVHSRGAAQMVRDLARRVGRLTSRTTS